MIRGFPEADTEEIRRRLDHGEVLSFVGRLSELQQKFPLELGGLSAAEQARYSRFRQPEDAWAFYAGRFLLREVLESLLSGRPLTIDLTEKGKPLCSQSGAPHFSLSHGGGWLLVSFCAEQEIGVDVETSQRKTATESLARRYFSASEQKQVRQGTPMDFYKIWTRKEARGKATGEGIRSTNSERCILETDWNYHEFQPDPQTLGVVAYPGVLRPHQLMKV